MSTSLQTLHKTRPYLVIVHSGLGLSAAYNRRYELLFEGASEQLLAYGAQWNTSVKRGFSLTQPDQQPSWMQYGLEDECMCYFLYKDFANARELMDIPGR